ncbi:MAG: hypothetical protein ACFB9M_12680 [Myxococcota bacterium]
MADQLPVPRSSSLRTELLSGAAGPSLICSEASPVFRAYKAWAIPTATLLGALVGVGLVPAVFLTIAAAAALGGWWLGLPALAAGAMTVERAFDRIGLVGNRRLQRDLRDRLRVPSGSVMVGICRPGRTGLRDISNRGGETDEQVGFLEFRRDRLLVHTELGTVTICANDLSNMKLMPFDLLTWIRWLELEWVEGHGHERILVASRVHPSIRRNIKETRRIMDRIRRWHADYAYPEEIATVLEASKIGT